MDKMANTNQANSILSDTSPGIYTYCLTRTPVSFPHTIIGIDGMHEVYSVEQEGIFAVLSDVSLKEYSEAALDKNMTDMAWLVPRAKRHEEVIEFVMTHATLNQHVISNSPLPTLPSSSSFSIRSKGEEERGRSEIHGLSEKSNRLPPPKPPPFSPSGGGQGRTFSPSVRGTGGGIQVASEYSPPLVGGVRGGGNCYQKKILQQGNTPRSFPCGFARFIKTWKGFLGL